MTRLIEPLRHYFKQLSCEHEWKYVCSIPQGKGLYLRVYHCSKCGKYKEEYVVE